ncbi:MAG TPA: type II 3-dehydroquinate dehydratase [Ignavibacteriaceae bacterium]|nr:type II 3-dehydroquinate dehydratase [Ignavibacteriaceae bacterium]
MKVLVLNGPNLNLLGKREESLYGSKTLLEIEKELKLEFSDYDLTFKHSNLEGELINYIQIASISYDALIINPGGYAHSSVAIRDALEMCNLPKIEVHLSNIASREDFRHRSITASKCDGYISGFKEHSYSAAIYLLSKLIIK